MCTWSGSFIRPNSSVYKLMGTRGWSIIIVYGKLHGTFITQNTYHTYSSYNTYIGVITKWLGGTMVTVHHRQASTLANIHSNKPVKIMIIFFPYISYSFSSWIYRRYCIEISHICPREQVQEWFQQKLLPWWPISLQHSE